MLEVEHPSFWETRMRHGADGCMSHTSVKSVLFPFAAIPLGPSPCALARVCSAVTSAWQTSSMLKTRDTSGAISEMLEMEARSASRTHPCPRCPLPLVHVHTLARMGMACRESGAATTGCRRLKPVAPLAPKSRPACSNSARALPGSHPERMLDAAIQVSDANLAHLGARASSHPCSARPYGGGAIVLLVFASSVAAGVCGARGWLSAAWRALRRHGGENVTCRDIHTLAHVSPPTPPFLPSSLPSRDLSLPWFPCHIHSLFTNQ